MLRIFPAAILSILLLGACSRETTLFEQMPAERTGISFENTLAPVETLNTYVFRNFYNGGGVAIGDVSGDGLADILLTGNQVSTRLYLNRGGFVFEDVTERAGLFGEGIWTTGVSLVDVNADGRLDVYMCKSGPPGGQRRHNELFINQGDGTFIERAEAWGLAYSALSVHASFFDYDGDKDLDAYLLSNPLRSLDELHPAPNLRNIPDPDGGNRLLRNDGPSLGFVDVTETAGIYNSQIGFGLGISAGDLDRDGWTDLYVSNDFFERDYLYRNAQDGTFEEIATDVFPSLSLSSMGGDVADLNGDGFPEIFISDMLPRLPDRYQSKISFPSWDEEMGIVRDGYHHQATRNTLQLNAGGPDLHFSDLSRMAGVEATDWSWGALMADFDHDGHREIFVPNGIYKDLLDQDFIARVSSADSLRALFTTYNEPILELLKHVPTHALANHMFTRTGPMTYADIAGKWGLDTPGFSNGAAYGDLDNDGDLDLVVNNINMPAFVYRNRSSELFDAGHWLQIVLKGQAPNTYGIGAQVTLWAAGHQWYVEQQPVRGFLSSMDPVLHIGFTGRPDSLVVHWSRGTRTVVRGLQAQTRITIEEKQSG